MRTSAHTNFKTVIGLLSIALWWNPVAAAKTIFVNPGAPHADDAGPGSRNRPLRTIATALQRLRIGDHLVIAPGLYRTTIDLRHTALGRGGAESTGATARTIIEGAADGTVTIKGSEVVGGWRALGNGLYVRDDWNINSEQVFVDGKPMKQIGGTILNGYPRRRDHPLAHLLQAAGGIWPGRTAGTQQSLPFGSFYYDESRSKLYLRVHARTLTRHQVEVSVRPFLLIGKGIHNLTVRNLHFEHANTSSVAQSGAVSLRGDGLVLEHIVVKHVDFAGFDISGNNNVVRDSIAEYCGQLGLKARGTHVRVIDNVFAFNNTRGFNKWWEAGGAKFVGNGGLHDSEVAGNTAYRNNGDGLWFDWMNRNNRIHDNVSAYNKGFGIQYEASKKALIVHNYVFSNGQRGIYLPNSSDSLVAYNLIARNGLQGIAIVDARPGRHGKYDLNPRANVIVGNIIAWNTGAALVLPTRAHANRSDYNVVVSKSGSTPAFSLGWGSRKHPTRHGLAAWQAASGQDQHSMTAVMEPGAALQQAWRRHVKRPDWSSLLDLGARLRIPSAVLRSDGGGHTVRQTWAGPA